MGARRKIGILCAEFLGALIYIMFGCLGCVEGIKFPNNGFQKGLNFGFLIMTLIQLFHGISGAHVNPCVTIAAIITSNIEWYMGLLYIVVQLFGNFAGYALAYLLGPKDIVRSNSFCVTQLAFGMELLDGVFIELLLTMGWTIAMCATWDKRNERFRDAMALRVGFIVAAMSITGGIFTGASMNPWRSLAPAVFHSNYNGLWIYFASPFIGAVLIGCIWRFFFGKPEQGNAEASGGEV